VPGARRSCHVDGHEPKVMSASTPNTNTRREQRQRQIAVLEAPRHRPKRRHPDNSRLRRSTRMRSYAASRTYTHRRSAKSGGMMPPSMSSRTSRVGLWARGRRKAYLDILGHCAHVDKEVGTSELFETGIIGSIRLMVAPPKGRWSRHSELDMW